MLAKTVRQNSINIQNLEMKRNKTVKFSSLFQSKPTVELNKSEIRQILMNGKLIEAEEDDSIFDEIAEVNQEPNIQTEEDEIAEYIVENPDEVVVQFPIVSDIKLEEKLPFFKAISYKLANL